MRAISPPTYSPEYVYDLCINSISDQNLRGRLLLIRGGVFEAAQDYLIKAQTRRLFSIPSNFCQNDEVVIGAVTKAELKKTYSDHMVGVGKPARYIYDLLIASAPRRKCPFCGFGHATTLDHYLPKAKFPLLSVIPWNLVPACKDCNTGKSSTIARMESEQTLHPYFERRAISEEQWVYARLITSAPPVLEFFVSPPPYWDEIEKARVESHFIGYKLATRFSVEASNELAALKDVFNNLWDDLGAEGVRLHLRGVAHGKALQHVNSWDTAMYQALAASAWYFSGGFRDFV
ncbi:HNH endonuclease [Pseudomonas prosekii]|uniref:HNH endonuclease n=1 Tax=Pseudomonas prosekii TaxID=1148509 RepID=UPI0011EB51AF|nr:HNH endonuclease signature motif containing protein [Pseudomonas prosekii]